MDVCVVTWSVLEWTVLLVLVSLVANDDVTDDDVTKDFHCVLTSSILAQWNRKMNIPCKLMKTTKIT